MVGIRTTSVSIGAEPFAAAANKLGYGPYGVVMLSRCNRFLHALLRQLCVEAEAAERSGWHAEYT